MAVDKFERLGSAAGLQNNSIRTVLPEQSGNPLPQNRMIIDDQYIHSGNYDAKAVALARGHWSEADIQVLRRRNP